MDMRRETIDYINNVTNTIINYYQLTLPIYDLVSFVNSLGGEIVDFKNSRLNNIIIVKIDDNHFRFILPLHKDSRFRTFEIAVALGHLFLHMGFKTNQEIWVKYSKNSRVEFKGTDRVLQANEFAYSLLMPKDIFEQAITVNTKSDYINGNKCNIVDINNMSKYFNLPISYVAQRGRDLGYFS